jgi:hypothetical protein
MTADGHPINFNHKRRYQVANEPKLVWTIEDVLMQFDWMTKLTPEELNGFEEQCELDVERNALATRRRKTHPDQNTTRNKASSADAGS